jgi:phenylalanyl-tRNA synthetase alpha subunit
MDEHIRTFDNSDIIEFLNNRKQQKREQKYFIAYVAYRNDCDNKTSKDFFNDIVYIDEEITSDLLDKIQDSLLNKANNYAQSHNVYYATQIINIVKL